MNNNLNTILKSKRLEKDMSLRQFSEFLGISHAYLSKLEKGTDPRTGKEIAPTMDTLMKISDALNINISTFLEMCGYTNKKTISLNSFKQSFEVFDLVEAVIDILLNAENLTYNGNPITRKDTEIITDALKIGVELALKRSM